MNFHKTIGYLATLLLMVGLGVPDSFAQTVKVSSISPVRVQEGQPRTVTITAELSAAVDAATTVDIQVALPGTLPTGVAIVVTRPDPNNPSGTINDFGNIEITDGTTGSTTATVTVTDNGDYEHPRDKEVALTLTNSGYTQVEGVMLTVREDDQPIGPLSLSADPPSFTMGGNSGTILTASVADAPGTEDADGDPLTAETPVVVTVSFDASSGIASNATISGDDKSATSNLTGVNVAAAGEVTVTASATNYTPVTITLQIIQRNANDVEGYRVTIASPGDGAWVGFGKKKVNVQVKRLNNVAFSWTEFQDIAISLRDTATVTGGGPNTDGNIYTLTAGSFADEDGNIVFSKAVSSNMTDDLGDDSDITYSEADDAITFAFEIVKANDASEAIVDLGTLTGEDAGTGEADNTPDDNSPRAGDSANGQRVGVFARAVFTVGTTEFTINSNDDEKKVFSSPATLGTVSAADQVVGDGKLIKIDLLAPANAATALVATVGDNEPMDVTDTTIEAKIGDEIKVAVGVSAQTRFRDEGIQVQIVTNKGSENGLINTGNANAATLKAANFSQLQVINAAGDSLRTSLELTSGLIKTKAVVDGNTRDGGEIKEDALFEPDYVMFRVRARTKDQAVNWSGWEQFDFRGDTRAPEISVLHPAAAGRFTGAHADVDFEEHLNPLQLRLDEDIKSLSVYAKGAYSADDDEDPDTDVSIIRLWEDENLNLDRSTVVAEAGADAVGDTISYGTLSLQWRNADGDLEATDQGGKKIDLVIVATDLVGNETKMTLAGVTHDEEAPEITDFFPKRNLLEDDDYQINDATRHPVFTLKEAVDSLSITYDPSSGEDIVHVVADGLPKGEHQEVIADPFVHDRTYSLSIFARDLAGNAFETPAEDGRDLKFNEEFDNPIANTFTVTYAETDSVIAGQLNDLTVQAVDNNGTADDDGDDRSALTHKIAARVSAWDMASGGVAESVRYHGGGVTDNGDGTAMLAAATWKLGKRTVQVSSNEAIGLTKILVQNLMDGEDGTTVATYEGAVDNLVVGAADFVGFDISAYEPDIDTGKQVDEISGNFDLKVVPVDRYGNASVRAYTGGPGKLAEADSLAILDTRVKDDGIEYKNGIAVTFASIPALEELNPLFVFDIPKEGQVFPILLPEGRRSLTIQVRVDNESLSPDPVDTRSQDVRTPKIFRVVSALSPVLTLWVPGSDQDEAGNDVVIPADPGDVTVTVAAAGFNAGSDITFTKDGTALDAVADDDGVAKLDITMSAAGTVTVSASDGRWDTDELSITFVEAPAEPTRMAYVDADGNAIYLIADGDMTVGVDDFLALVAAYGSSEGDDNYNIQADVDDDGDVDVDDFLTFITSFGKEAVGPSTKPLVLLPGVNENAEFSLSLGSERVVAGELVAVDVSLANVQALMGYGFALNYETDKFEFVSVAPADEDLLKSTGGETLFHHIVADGHITVANGVYNGTAVSGGGDVVRFVFRVLREFEDNARFEIADGLVFDPSQLQNPAVVAGVLELQSTPREFALHQNFPNPFNPDTTIKYDLAESADVTLQIYNVLGQVVRTLVASEAQNAGRYQIRWNGMDDRGVPVSSGIYFYRISAEGKFQNVRKLMLLK